MMRESHTAVIERHLRAHGRWETEPYEVAWASEVIVFVYLTEPSARDVEVRLQLSADGMRWIDDIAGVVPMGATAGFVKLRHFGGWLRCVLELGASGSDTEIDVYLAAKG